MTSLQRESVVLRSLTDLPLGGFGEDKGDRQDPGPPRPGTAKTRDHQDPGPPRPGTTKTRDRQDPGPPRPGTVKTRDRQDPGPPRPGTAKTRDHQDPGPPRPGTTKTRDPLPSPLASSLPVCARPGPPAAICRLSEAGLFLKAASRGSILRRRVTPRALPGSRRPPAARVLERIAVR
ncbi:fibrinogen alpha chain-like isoform X2 [Pseudoliparis swirei]|nr:fibrinogen alpha chain-like isoform X2 [Pseudoliparis swirei]